MNLHVLTTDERGHLRSTNIAGRSMLKRLQEALNYQRDHDIVCWSCRMIAIKLNRQGAGLTHPPRDTPDTENAK